MSLTKNTYNIGEFSQLTGIPTSTLRYYETENLIKPQRSANGHRYYTRDDFDWLRFLNHLKGAGMSIADLKQYIMLREQGDKTIPQRLALLKTTKNNFLKELSEIQQHLQILNDKINWYEAKVTGIISDSEKFKTYLEHLGHENY
ncbi:MerR family transcriptional regulator [Weissella sagaensis]|uniref:MerR family transcriptional regulator n=1 Tax=Weissella sagaensis TaxID=2559928 RepID=A0ABW1RTY4_9LACO|nr:MerR family transcriptional regulator [Weissella sagaensis]QDJ59098.1 MerR family transcriptional regulator [Weissella hellenica]QEA56390.1 MerR family transcriptional regulator [Weissella hellenica]UEG67212.1 MerR family transcriptional regulator [Weissella hellenica]